MVKVTKNDKKLGNNISKKNDIKSEVKQKLVLKSNENTGEGLRKKIKKVKGSKDMSANVQSVVQPKEKKVLKKIERKNTLGEMGVSEASKLKVKNSKKQNSENEKVPANKFESDTKTKLEAKCFEVDQFESIVSLKNIKEACKALRKLVEDEVTKKKSSIFSDYRYFLNVASYKIPNCPKRMVKLNLKHSLVDPNEDDIAFIVPDLKRGAKFDYEPTIQHYEDLLHESGVKGLKIIPFNQLRNEYTTFESKRKLANTYDYFLCDGRIAGHVVGFCGKNFQKPRTTIHSVHLNDSHKYKANIEKALKRTSFKQLHKGDIISIPVGSYRFTTSQVGENIKLVIDQLKTLIPGGYENIRNMHVKIDIKGTSALPIYVNLAGPPPETPNVIGPREKRMLKLKKQANEMLSKFNICKTGEFVKLNKSQIERKRHIRETNAALISKKNDSNENDTPPRKKTKKNKDIASIKQSEVSEDEGLKDSVEIDSENDNEEDR